MRTTRTSRIIPGVHADLTSPDQQQPDQRFASELDQLHQYYQHGATTDSVFFTAEQTDEPAAAVIRAEMLNNKYDENIGSSGASAMKPENGLSGSKSSAPNGNDDSHQGVPIAYQNPIDDPDPEDAPAFAAGALPPESLDGNDDDNVIDGDDFDNWINGFGGDDALSGFGGSDVIDGGFGNDTLNGGDDTDYLSGRDGDDTINGDEGDDFLWGGKDSDHLFGGIGNDHLYGDEGTDFLFGEEGDDEFMDGAGNDEYTGGPGADTFRFFQFYIGGVGGGQDKVLDFELGVDRLVIGNGFGNDEFNGLTFNQYIDQYASGGGEAGVVIEWAYGLIRLPGIDKEDLNPWDIDILA